MVYAFEHQEGQGYNCPVSHVCIICERDSYLRLFSLARAKSAMKTSGKFRLPLTLRANHRQTKEIIKGSTESKRRVVTYLPPPMITAHLQNSSHSESSHQLPYDDEQENIMMVEEGNVETSIVTSHNPTMPPHNASGGDPSAICNSNHARLRRDDGEANHAIDHRQLKVIPNVEGVVQVDMAELARNYPGTKMMMSKVRDRTVSRIAAVPLWHLMAASPLPVAQTFGH